MPRMERQHVGMKVIASIYIRSEAQASQATRPVTSFNVLLFSQTPKDVLSVLSISHVSGPACFCPSMYLVAKMLPSYDSAVVVVVKEKSLSWCEARKLCKKSVKDCTAAKGGVLVMKMKVVDVVVS